MSVQAYMCREDFINKKRVFSAFAEYYDVTVTLTYTL